MSVVVQDVYTEVQEHAEAIKNDAEHDLRDTFEVGDAWAQGDILIRKIKEVPPGTKAVPPVAQLAPGTTQGSRHCINSLSDLNGDHVGIKMYHFENPTALQGPVFTVAKECTVTHPEHGDVKIGKGTYGIEYQRAFAEELKRRLD